MTVIDIKGVKTRECPKKSEFKKQAKPATTRKKRR